MNGETPPWQAVEAQIDALWDKQLLFVTGAVKSGTTWTQLWLDAHPEIACRGEGAFFHRIGGAFQAFCKNINELFAEQVVGRGPTHPPFPKIESPQLLHLMRQMILSCLGQYGADPSLRVVGEKTPSSVLALDTIFLCFPEAKILHLIRDGRDVTISAWHDNQRKNKNEFRQIYPTFGTYLPDMAQIWINHQRPILDLAPDHKAQVKAIHYESLLGAPEETLRDVFQWLKVDASDDVIAACLDKTRFEKLAKGRKPGEEDPKSFYRSGTAEQWREVMTAEQQESFWRMAGEVMATLGYDREGLRR